jgi:hypothetical protein
MPAGSDPFDFQALRSFVQARFAADAGLNSLLESAVGYSPSIYYAAITDTGRQVMVHNDPGEIGQVMAPAPPFDDLLHAGLLRQLRVIYGPSRVYEVVLPLEIGDKPFGDVRVGVSTLFLGHQITPDLHAALTLSFAIIIFTTIASCVPWRPFPEASTCWRAASIPNLCVSSGATNGACFPQN